jgi:hypothetical protein
MNPVTPRRIKVGVIMFVVRLKRPNEDFDFRTFGSINAAVTRFRTAQSLLIAGDLEQCALFDAEASDAGSAIAMVNEGKAILLESNLSDGPAQAGARTD